MILPDLVEVEPGYFEVDASELRWVPGVMPNAVPVSFGNGRPLIVDHVSYGPAGELISVTYAQEFGSVRVTVFND